MTFNPRARDEFKRFRNRDDTLSLGVCNGCQLLGLLGWVGEREDEGEVVSFIPCMYVYNELYIIYYIYFIF